MSNTNLTDFFKGIKHNYPKSYKRFQQWLQRCSGEGRYMQPVVDSAINFDMYIYLNFRDLYDFFDDTEVFVDVMYGTKVIDEEGLNIDIQPDTSKWYFSLAGIDYEDEELDKFYPSRKQAETAVFMRAFQILEERI